MPLYKSIQVDDFTSVLIWKITESLTDLSSKIALSDLCQHRLQMMKSELHQKGFLSVRKLLEQAGYKDSDLFYDPNGKPNLKDGKHISISHSFGFSTLVISDKKTGIDLERQREKIIKIADKFTNFNTSFFDKSNIEQTIRQLTVIWGIKEAIYKFYSINGLSFKKNIHVVPFDIERGKIEAVVTYQNFSNRHFAEVLEFEGYTLVYLRSFHRNEYEN